MDNDVPQADSPQSTRLAADYITALKLSSHPEGGYYAQTYEATESIPQSALPDRFKGSRAYSTAIYFLLENDHFSALHRIQSDEVWHFYAGGPLLIYAIDPVSGTLTTVQLGNKPGRGDVFQAVVPAGCWFGAKSMGLPAEPSFSLVGCTVSPGFNFTDFELAERGTLLSEFPQHETIIRQLT